MCAHARAGGSDRAPLVPDDAADRAPVEPGERELSEPSILLARSRRLRAIEEADADELYALADENRAYLARWLPWAQGQTAEGMLQFVRSAREQSAEGNGCHMAIIEEGRIIGMVGFHGIDWQHRTTSLGYWLAQWAQGQGAMTEAVRAMVTHALRVWELNRVEIRASVENARSRALIERLGFQFEGVARQAFRLADRYDDDAVYSMLASEWRE